MNWLLMAIGIPLFILFVAVPWLNGAADFYIAHRFRRDNKSEKDQTAFLLNWIAFKWSWVSVSDKIVEAMPFFKKDLTETFGIRPDDGRVT